jgi:hypothetical protein
MTPEDRNAYMREYTKQKRDQCREALQTVVELRAENERIKEQFRTLTGRRPDPTETQPSHLLPRLAQLVLDLQAWHDRLAKREADQEASPRD